jgi:hypothetical protein
MRPEPPPWTRRYEQLREQVLSVGGAISATDARGLSLLMGQGVTAWMRAWMRAWQELPRGDAAAGSPAEERPIRLATAWQQEAARLLANMALRQLTPPPS